MIYSNACEYAIRALGYLVLQGEEKRLLLRNIAKEEGIPGPFLGKVFQTLVKEQILDSIKGPGGGYKLARPASEITLFDIKKAIDGTREMEACAIGLAECSDEQSCPLHQSWKPIRKSIIDYLEGTTLRDMVSAVKSKKK